MLGVDPNHFDEQMEVLRRRTTVQSLDELLRSHSEGAISPGSVAVTFDDGYRDNLIHAKPILQKHDVPATVFVTTGYLSQTREYWWDEVQRHILESPRLPGHLELEIGGATRTWSVEVDPDSGEETEGWNVLEAAPHGSRRELYRFLCEALKPIATGDRIEILDRLAAWCGNTVTPRPDYRALSNSEVAELEGDSIRIGAHTVSHPTLSGCATAEQRREIVSSREQLERILGHPVSVFAYPYGNRSDYTPETVELVREAGFTAACSTVPEPVWRRTDVHQLPRYVMRNWDGNEFGKRIEKWLR